jgi:hypothetical protein
MITETKIGFTILVFELSAPEAEFSTYSRSFQGQITYTYLNELFLLLDYVFFLLSTIHNNMQFLISFLLIFFNENKGTLNS